MSALLPISIQAGSTITEQMYQYIEDLGDFTGITKKRAQCLNLASRIFCSLSLLNLSQDLKVLQPLASRTWLLLTPIISKALETAIDNESFRAESASWIKKNIYTSIKTVSKYSSQILSTATHVALLINHLQLGYWYAAAISITPLLSLSMVFCLPQESKTSEESDSEESNFELFKEDYSEKRLLDSDVLGFLSSLQNEGVEESEIRACIDMATQNLRNEQSKEVLRLKEEGNAICAALEKKESGVLPRLIDYLERVQNSFYLYEKERVKTLLNGESALSDFVDTSTALQEYLQFVEENKASLANCINCFLNSIIANDCTKVSLLLRSASDVDLFFNDDDGISLSEEADRSISLLEGCNLDIHSFYALRQSFKSLNTDYERYNNALLKIEGQIEKRKQELSAKIHDQFIARIDKLLDQECQSLKLIQEQYSPSTSTPGAYSLKLKSKTYVFNQDSDGNDEFLRFISDNYQTLSLKINGFLSYNMYHFLPDSWCTQSEIQAQWSQLTEFMAEKRSDLSFLLQLNGITLFSPNIMQIWQDINDQEGDLNTKISKYLKLKSFISDSDLLISSSILANISDKNKDLQSLYGYAVKKGILNGDNSLESFLVGIRKLKSKKDEILAKIDTLTSEVDKALKKAPNDEALLN